MTRCFHVRQSGETPSESLGETILVVVGHDFGLLSVVVVVVVAIKFERDIVISEAAHAASGKQPCPALAKQLCS